MYVSSCPYVSIAFICCRVCPKAHVHTSTSIRCTCRYPPSQLVYATTDPKGKGLKLLDAIAVAELCPMTRSAGYCMQTPVSLSVSPGISCNYSVCHQHPVGIRSSSLSVRAQMRRHAGSTLSPIYSAPTNYIMQSFNRGYSSPDPLTGLL